MLVLPVRPELAISLSKILVYGDALRPRSGGQPGTARSISRRTHTAAASIGRCRSTQPPRRQKERKRKPISSTSAASLEAA